ncbi:MAG: hypothetical protein M3Y07_17845 [Acidobacteriota bacterium]|nr:hypothetical protein [Acidobacteriota bacterium]
MRQATLRSGARVWIGALPLILLGTAEASLGLFQYCAGDGTARGTYTSRDHYAGLLEMTMPLAVMWAVALLRRRRDREPEMGLILGACALPGVGATMFLAIVHSLSRMGFIAALAALFAMGALAVMTARHARFGNISTAQGISSDTRLQI